MDKPVKTLGGQGWTEERKTGKLCLFFISFRSSLNLCYIMIS